MLSSKQDRSLIFLLLGWAALALAALFLRPLWPVDETRYLAVAWEMWHRGDFLVPYLNGEPYSHKPPLLFWLIHAGWAVFGVNEWWPRLVPSLLAFVGVVLMRRLARQLWPAQTELANTATWIVFGTFLFAGLFTLLGFDPLLMCSTLIGMLGTVRAAQGERTRGLLWLGVGIGLGVLSKGPVILLHLLPAAVLAPWWARLPRGEIARWYLGVLGALLLGAAIALAWAVPAAYFGGEAYRNAIFWGQTAGRMTESFAHRAAWWHYLAMLPLMLFPWFLWPAFWRGVLSLRESINEPGVRFLFAWIVPVFVGFSLISGKQIRYLLPLIPAFALFAAYALQRVKDKPARFDLLLPALACFLLSGAWFYLRLHPAKLDLPDYTATFPAWPAWAFALVGAALLFAGRAMLMMRLRVLALSMLALLTVAYLSVIPLLAPYIDTRPVAQHLARLQARDVPIAYWGKYHAQFNFAGRLTKPFALVDNDSVQAWARQHPQGRIVVIDRAPTASAAKPEVERLFRGAYVKVWIGESLLAAKSGT
ncbi:MAG: glycosyltransferase family 39 protein [Burkholderiales bacterium]|nr:glycosyltransferase family 39 protein [Burkholderiales bacterium]